MRVCDAEPLAGFPEPYGMLLAILEDGTREWIGELGDLEALDAAAMTWRARAGGPTMGALMLHNIAVEYAWLVKTPTGVDFSDELAATLMWDDIDVDRGLWPDPPAQPFSWYLGLLKEQRERTLETAKTWPEFGHVFPRSWGDVTMGWIVGHVIQHESYHGGQIVLLNESRIAQTVG